MQSRCVDSPDLVSVASLDPNTPPPPKVACRRGLSHQHLGDGPPGRSAGEGRTPRHREGEDGAADQIDLVDSAAREAIVQGTRDDEEEPQPEEPERPEL